MWPLQIATSDQQWLLFAEDGPGDELRLGVSNRGASGISFFVTSSTLALKKLDEIAPRGSRGMLASRRDAREARNCRATALR
jgi:hypothetical protein